MELTEVYRRAPGCCMVCRTPSTANGVIDLRVDEPDKPGWSHSAYLCGECAFEVGRLIAPRFGWQFVSSDVIAELAVAHNDIANLQARVDEAEAVFAMIRGDVKP